MKIAITGHTQGIGLAIYNSLINTNSVIGLSTSTGFNINNVEQIIDNVKDCDCFINNAYCDQQQEKILSELYKLWKGQQKIIINIGSAVTDYPRLEKDKDSEPWPYRDNKISLVKTFRKLSYEGNDLPRLVLIQPGATDTDLIKHINCVKLSADKVADAVNIALKNSFIKEITVYEK